MFFPLKFKRLLNFTVLAEGQWIMAMSQWVSVAGTRERWA